LLNEHLPAVNADPPRFDRVFCAPVRSKISFQLLAFSTQPFEFLLQAAIEAVWLIAER
jgi:hypothetical protein